MNFIRSDKNLEFRRVRVDHHDWRREQSDNVIVFHTTDAQKVSAAAHTVAESMTEFGRRGLVQNLHARSSEFGAQGRAWTIKVVLIMQSSARYA